MTQKPLSESLEICCASCPNYGPFSVKSSIDLEKLFPTYFRWKFELISQGIVNKVNKNYQYFRVNFPLQSLRNCLSVWLEICCAICYGPLWIKISSDSDKRFPSYCSRKLARKYWQFLFTLFTIPCDINSNIQRQLLGNSESIEILIEKCP